MVIRARTKLIEVEAIQWTGDNIDEVRSFCIQGCVYFFSPSGSEGLDIFCGSSRWDSVDPNDYIIKEGEIHYVVTEKNFEHYYEIVN